MNYRMKIKNIGEFIFNYNRFIPQGEGLEWGFLDYEEQTEVINALYSLEKNNRWKDVMSLARRYKGTDTWSKCIVRAAEELDIY